MIKPDLLRKSLNCNGFTLIEVIVVVVLVGIMATIAAPRLLDYLPNMRLKSASRDLYSSMHEARSTAVKNNSPAAIVFSNSGDANPQNHSYGLYDDPGADGNWGTIADNNLVTLTNLSSYGGDAQYGHLGIATNHSVTSGQFPVDHVSYNGLPAANPKWLLFNPNGTCNGGYVYLDNGTSLFAVGTRPSGFIKLFRWNGGAKTWQ